jgi:hypothetical protein
MTPKEKAEELFTTYRFSLSIPNALLGDLNDSIAKQCALIAVDEILKTEIHVAFYWDETTKHIISFQEYYKEVKKELEKLWHQGQRQIYC